MAKLEIWKLQRPLFTTGDINEIMAYTEDKQRQAFITIDGETMDELFGDEPKVYVLANVKKGNLVINQMLEEQDW